MLDKHNEHFLARVYTPTEIKAAGRGKKTAQYLAGRFAAKEAVLKLLSTGLIGKMRWTEIETTNDSLGKPEVSLSGEVLAVAEKAGIKNITISITHTADMAMASAVAITNNNYDTERF